VVEIAVSTEVQIFLGIILLVAFWGFMSSPFVNLPPQFAVLQPVDIGLLTGETIGITSACVVAPALTGAIACPVVLSLVGLVNILAIFLLPNQVIAVLIITPISAVLIYIWSRLASHGG
jgi:hypothetical protein